MEAIILAGGKGERLGDASGGRPKPLVPVGGRPLAAYEVAQLAAAGVRRVVVSCAAGAGALFREALGDIGPEIVPVEEPEPLGRGGGLRLASEALGDEGPCFALNGDELVDLDFRTLAARHEEHGGAATIVVTPRRSPFGGVGRDGAPIAAGGGAAAEGALRALRHEGVWLTVNTQKDLRAAERFVAEHPGWPGANDA